MRSSKSAARIREAFISLLEEFPQGPITVTQIAQRAHVNRITFYRLFETKEAVLEDILDGFTEENDETIAQIRNDRNLREPLIRMSLEHHKRHMPTLRTILNSYLRLVFVQRVEEGIRAPISSVQQNHSGCMGSLYTSFYVAGISHVICDWVQGGCKESIDEVLTFLANVAVQADYQDS